VNTHMPVVVSSGGACRHCDRGTERLRPRGLCDRCYRVPKVRNRYQLPATSWPYAPGPAAGAGPGKRPLPPCPTSARPGTLRKICIMMRRLESGYHLHHPQDAPMNGPDQHFVLPCPCLLLP